MIFIKKFLFVLFVCIMLAIWYLYPSIVAIFFSITTSPERLGQFGDLYGSLNALISIFACIGLFITIRLQLQQTNKIKIDNDISNLNAHFFSLIQFHKDHVNNLSYSRKTSTDEVTHDKQKVFHEIYVEFVSCYDEIDYISKHLVVSDICTTQFEIHANDFLIKSNTTIGLKNFLVMNLAWICIYHGIGTRGKDKILKRLELLYKVDYLKAVIYFLRVKPYPLMTSDYSLKKWQNLRKAIDSESVYEELMKVFDDNKDSLTIKNLCIEDNTLSNTSTKYYGGHEHRLSNYIKNFIMALTLVHNNENMPEQQKNTLIAIFLSQMSSYELILLALDSLSTSSSEWCFLKPDSKNYLVKKFNIFHNDEVFFKEFKFNHLYGA